MYDVVIIGGGVCGVSIAHALSAYQANICLVEQGAELCTGTSKANSAIIHGGYDAPTGSLMARLNVVGSTMMPELSQRLGVPFRRNGSMVICLDQGQWPALEALYQRGLANGVQGLYLVDRQGALDLEPALSPQVVGALVVPTGGIVCPFALTYAFGELAATNGVAFHFQTQVEHIAPTEYGWHLTTSQGGLDTKVVINAAGVQADTLHNLVSATKLHITPRRGEYLLLDRETQGTVSHTIFQLPNHLGKGVLVTPTIHGNTLVGPTAADIDNKTDTSTTQAGLQAIAQSACVSVPSLPLHKVITSFAGLRAHRDGGFFIQEVDDAPGFFDCAGIASPGLSAAPAIGPYVADLVVKKLQLTQKPTYATTRDPIVNPQALSFTQRQALITADPSFGRIICRCESISEGEIRQAIRRPLGATTVDGVKRRVRTGMGRCQGGFCAPKIMEILAQELQIDLSEVTKAGPGSPILLGYNKDSVGGSDETH